MAKLPEPWSPEKRNAIKARIDAEAAELAVRLGARGIVIIALFPEGEENIHMQDGGTPLPMPVGQLYWHMASAHDIVQQSGGKDVKLQ